MMVKRVALLVTVVAVVLAAGCANTTVTTEVGADGGVETMSIETEVQPIVYGFMEQSAQEEGYESVEEWLRDDAVDGGENDVQFDDVSVTETDDGNYRISMSASDVAPADLAGVSVTVTEDTVRYELSDVGEFGGADEFGGTDDGFDVNSSFGEEFTIDFVLVMPGQISDSNADEISDDGTTATWTIDGSQQSEESFYAESDTSGADGLPGFGPGVAVVALALSAAGLGLRNR